MEQIENRPAVRLGLLVLLLLSLVIGCSGSDSEADVPLQLDSVAGSRHLRLVALHITGMS